MGKINKMSTHLANMIAAGEVVERPSSVVKELVENSIDAGAAEIKIYLKNGGLELIKVIDDGCGMESDDVVMAFLPHATSKIKTEQDLFRINSLGFRGEAIPSIAAVSELTITSSTDGINGYYCKYKAGSLALQGVTHSNKGTTVECKGLFFNTPARLKYMKSAKSELASIMFFIDRISLAHPSLRFTVIHDEKIIFNTTGSNDDKTLIAEIYGIEAAKNIITTAYTQDGYKARIVAVKPSIYRSNKLEITMICNGRYVKNYNITNAVVEAFQTYLPISKYPIVVLYFEIDSLLIDVNVHPSKTEIKISNEEEISSLLISKIKELLEENSHIPTRQIINDNPSYIKGNILEDIMLNDNEVIYTSNSEEYIKQIEDFTEASNTKQMTNAEIVKNDEIILEESSSKISYMEYVGCVFGTYLIFQNSEGMYMLDQHAAAERINYEKYYEILANPNQPKSDLLIPIVIELTKPEAIYLEGRLNEFEAIGFTIEAIGERDFAVRAVPLWAKVDKIEGIVYDIISMMINNKKVDIMYFRDHIAKQISCKVSIKANHQLSKNEIDFLFTELNKCKNPYTCPHGRPTLIKFTASDIEKMFERIQK